MKYRFGQKFKKTQEIEIFQTADVIMAEGRQVKPKNKGIFNKYYKEFLVYEESEVL